MIPSPRDVKTYDLKPEMSASGVADAAIKGIRSNKYQFVLVNFANCDMVGHTGVFEAAIKAVETVDTQLERLVTAATEAGFVSVIIADHGNAEQMIDYETGAPHTQHTTYPVPMIVVAPSGVSTPDLPKEGALCDVAPYIRKIMGI